ncbi:MAG: hypothetical protein FJ279_15430 [Planctomycetes bacterium]|nr:hypothetical protein [Planctomycetota bacterium]
MVDRVLAECHRVLVRSAVGLWRMSLLKYRKRGIVNPHVAARAAVPGGVPTPAEDGGLSNRALRNPSESDGFLRVGHEDCR